MPEAQRAVGFQPVSHIERRLNTTHNGIERLNIRARIRSGKVPTSMTAVPHTDSTRIAETLQSGAFGPCISVKIAVNRARPLWDRPQREPRPCIPGGSGGLWAGWSGPEL